MIRGPCVCYAECIRFQSAAFKIFIEPQAKLNLKHDTYHKKLIMRNRWGGITRLFQMDVSPLAPVGHVFTDDKKITM